MVEAVGQRWWGAYLDCIARNLKPGGSAALQFISIDHRLFDRYARNPDFIQTYIFPGGMLLDEPRFEALAHERGLTWEDREAFRLDYAETLRSAGATATISPSRAASSTASATRSTISGAIISCIAKAASAAARSTWRS